MARNIRVCAKGNSQTIDVAEFADLPTTLRVPALELLSRFQAEYGRTGLLREEIINAIKSPSFRPVLEQEARLKSSNLIS